MKTWIWPISWHCRIRELQRENATLRQMNRDLESQLRARVMAETSMMVAYTSSLSAISAEYLQVLKRR